MGNDMSGVEILGVLNFVFILVVSLSVHEWAHAFSASKLGDDTPEEMGRLTLNPLPHIDLLGTLVLPVIAFSTGGMLFGWAKPVLVNTANLKYGRFGYGLVAFAGPFSNIILSVISALIFGITASIIGDGDPNHTLSPLLSLCAISIKLNSILAFFNMIPFSPLDGGAVLKSFLPLKIVNFIEKNIDPYGFVLLIVLIFSGKLSFIFHLSQAWSNFLFSFLA
jgi:Zn-dependent protease